MLVMLPFAPWVFGTAAIALAYLPALAAPHVGRRALLFSALATGLTALAGGCVTGALWILYPGG